MVSALARLVALRGLRKLSPPPRLWFGCGLLRLRSLALGIVPARALRRRRRLRAVMGCRVRANPLAALEVPSLAARICAPIGSPPLNLVWKESRSCARPSDYAHSLQFIFKSIRAALRHSASLVQVYAHYTALRCASHTARAFRWCQTPVAHALKH